MDATKGFLSAVPFRQVEAQQGFGVLRLCFAADGHGVVVALQGTLLVELVYSRAQCILDCKGF